MANEAQIPAPRLFRDGDETALLTLLSETFGRWPAVELTVPPLEHLRWKLRRDASPPAEHCVIEHEGRLIACWLTIPRFFKAQRRELHVFDVADVAVHPDFQGRRLFAVIRNYAMFERVGTEMDLRLSATRAPAIARITEGAPGRRALANAPQILVRPLSFAAPARRMRITRANRSRFSRRLVYVSAEARRLLRRRESAGGWSLSQSVRFDARLDAFCEAAAQPYDFIGARDAAYLNRRHADPRGGRALIALAEEGERLLGFSVLRLSYGRAYLAELLALPERLDVAASLLAAALADARGAGALEMECLLPAYHPYQPLLRREGFRSTGSSACNFEPTRATPESIAFLDDPRATVHFMFGDTDLA